MRSSIYQATKIADSLTATPKNLFCFVILQHLVRMIRNKVVSNFWDEKHNITVRI